VHPVSDITINALIEKLNSHGNLGYFMTLGKPMTSITMRIFPFLAVKLVKL